MSPELNEFSQSEYIYLTHHPDHEIKHDHHPTALHPLSYTPQGKHYPNFYCYRLLLPVSWAYTYTSSFLSKVKVK